MYGQNHIKKEKILFICQYEELTAVRFTPIPKASAESP